MKTPYEIRRDAYREKEIRRAKEFASMPVSGTCDSNCGRAASKWFGRTAAATCGAAECVAIQQAEYDK